MLSGRNKSLFVCIFGIHCLAKLYRIPQWRHLRFVAHRWGCQLRSCAWCQLSFPCRHQWGWRCRRSKAPYRLWWFWNELLGTLHAQDVEWDSDIGRNHPWSFVRVLWHEWAELQLPSPIKSDITPRKGFSFLPFRMYRSLMSAVPIHRVCLAFEARSSTVV